MKGRSLEGILKAPILSEKSYAYMQNGRYIFRCRPDAEKIEIKQAVETIFADQKINVIDVNTMKVKGKERLRSRRNKRIRGFRANWKKAIVTLAPGQKISGFFEDL